MPTAKEILAQIAAQNTPETHQEPKTEEIVEDKIEKVEAKVVSPEAEVPNKVETPTEPQELAKPEVVTDETIELPSSEPETNDTFDFSSYIKDVGIDAKDPEEFKAKVKELINKEDPLTNLPEKVRKAVEFAMKGGDIYQILKVSEVDYSQIDPKTIYESYIYSMVKDKDKAAEHLDSMSDIVKEIEGEKMRQEYMNAQRRQEQELTESLDRKAQEELDRRKANEARLKETLNNVTDVSGFKVKQSQKEKFFKEVTSGNLSKRLFYDKEGNYDYNKMFKITFLADNFDQIQDYYKDRVKTATKRETIEELTNATINKPEGVPPLDTTEPDPLMNWAKSLREKGKPRTD